MNVSFLTQNSSCNTSTAAHLTVVIQLGQRDIHGLVLFLQLIIASLPTIQLQLRVVQGSFQLFSV